MKILSVRKGFQADHSSTSYEFLAIDKPLGPAECKAVAKLSSRASPTKRTVSFIYHAEGYDIPGGWEPLMKKYYDVMYSESYDWWTLVMAFNANQKTIKEIRKYDFSGKDDMGVSVVSKGDRVIVAIHCRLGVMESNGSLLNLLAQNREYLQKGDYRLLYGVWKKYGDAEATSPEPSGMNKLPKPVKNLLSSLEKI